MSEPPLVYLDSSDFSELSRESRTPEIESVRRQLLRWSREGQVRFAFSGVHLSEMAPLGGGFPTQAAVAKADLLVELCGRRAFIALNTLWELELRSLGQGRPPDVVVTNELGDWFPAWEDALLTPVKWVDTLRLVDEETKHQGLNRAMRRALRSKISRGGRPTPEARSVLVETGAKFDYQDLVRLFPMKLADAEVLGRYTVGAASQEEAEAAFLESLRDPRWMMRWFSMHADKLSPLTQWFRAPASSMTEMVKRVAAAAAKLHSFGQETGSSLPSDLLSAQAWKRQQDEMLSRLSLRLHGAIVGSAVQPGISHADVDRTCPGFAAMVRTAHSAMRASTTATPRQPKNSDFVDAVHAMYAPYVDVFRTDGFMAPVVEAHVPQTTEVVGKLNLLPKALAKRL